MFNKIIWPAGQAGRHTGRSFEHERSNIHHAPATNSSFSAGNDHIASRQTGEKRVGNINESTSKVAGWEGDDMLVSMEGSFLSF